MKIKRQTFDFRAPFRAGFDCGPRRLESLFLPFYRRAGLVEIAWDINGLSSPRLEE
ncbi:MAG: hypothetical protein ACRD2L_13610 [Terriglobia bacterium]